MPARTRARRIAAAGTPDSWPMSASPKPMRFASASELPSIALLGLDELREALREPRRDACRRRERVGIGPSVSKQGDEAPEASVGRSQEGREVRRRTVRQLPRGVLPQPSAAARLERSDRLEQRGAELAVDRHGLAGRLHLHPKRPISARELVERPARQLDDHVVYGGLEGSRSRCRSPGSAARPGACPARSGRRPGRSDSRWPLTPGRSSG